MGTPANCHLNGISLADRGYPANTCSGIWILSLPQTKNKIIIKKQKQTLSKTKPSGSAHAYISYHQILPFIRLTNIYPNSCKTSTHHFWDDSSHHYLPLWDTSHNLYLPLILGHSIISFHQYFP